MVTTGSSGGNSNTNSNTNSGLASSGETSIRVVIFSGKKDDWETWKEKFLVRSSLKGYEEILTGEVKAPDTHDDTNTKITLSADDQMIADQNKKGFGDLILSIDSNTSHGKIAFAIVKGSKTNKIPGGDLNLALKDYQINSNRSRRRN